MRANKTGISGTVPYHRKSAADRRSRLRRSGAAGGREEERDKAEIWTREMNGIGSKEKQGIKISRKAGGRKIDRNGTFVSADRRFFLR